jgi:hypothetical protein
MSKAVTVLIKAHFPQMKPAHHAFISKQGSGSSLDIAIRDAMHNIMIDERLKGKRAANIVPFKTTVTTVEKVDLDEETDTGSTD